MTLLTWSGVFEDKVFIIKLPTIYGLATGAVVVGEVPTLAHELRDDAMKAAALKAEALLVRAQAAEILCRGHIKKTKQTKIHFKNVVWCVKDKIC